MLFPQHQSKNKNCLLVNMDSPPHTNILLRMSKINVTSSGLPAFILPSSLRLMSPSPSPSSLSTNPTLFLHLLSLCSIKQTNGHTLLCCLHDTFCIHVIYSISTTFSSSNPGDFSLQQRHYSSNLLPQLLWHLRHVLHLL